MSNVIEQRVKKSSGQRGGGKLDPGNNISQTWCGPNRRGWRKTKRNNSELPYIRLSARRWTGDERPQRDKMAYLVHEEQL